MFKNFTKAAVIASLAAASLGFATSAEARDHYRHRGGDGAAIAIGAGVLGLAVGAAIASDHGDRRYRDRRYYRYPRSSYYGGYFNSYPRRRYDRHRYYDHDRRDRRVRDYGYYEGGRRDRR